MQQVPVMTDDLQLEVRPSPVQRPIVASNCCRALQGIASYEEICRTVWIPRDQLRKKIGEGDLFSSGLKSFKKKS
jgi:hypothetical protein